MIWDVASIVFVCVTMNHLGLIKAIEDVTKVHELPIVSCVKCFTFWSVLAYGLYKLSFGGIITVLAMSFLASYVAIWLELTEGIVDTLYNRIYEKIFADAKDDEDSADGEESDTDCAVPDLRKEN